MKSTVYVYVGPGASKHDVRHTMYMLEQNLSSQYKIHTIQAKEVIQGEWVNDAALFVLPGGFDMLYVKKLTPDANPIIRRYVEDGGAFLGICAGAYYSGSKIKFRFEDEPEFTDVRELAFFPGTVTGPTLKRYDSRDKSGAAAVGLEMKNPKIDNVKVFYIGGGCFVDAHTYDNVKVIANYKTQGEKAAIISVKYGKGVVLLSNVHFEYAPELLDQNDPYLKEIIPDLETNSSGRVQLRQSLLEMLGLSTNKGIKNA